MSKKTFQNSFQLGMKLAKVNFKLRNEGSFLGVFWYLIDPLLLFVIILTIRSSVGGGLIDDYPLYLLIGLIMFNFFSGTTSKSIKLISGNSNFIKSMKINPESIILSQVFESLFGHLIEILIFLGFMIYFKVELIWIFAYPMILLFYVLFNLGASFLLSTIGVFVDDLRNIWGVLTKILFFSTPLFYLAAKGTLIYKLNHLNPLYYFISITRSIIIYNEIPEIRYMVIAASTSIILPIIGYMLFKKYKPEFAEMV